MPWTKISDDITSLPIPQQHAAVNAVNAEHHRQVHPRDKGRHRAAELGVSRRVIGTLSGAVLVGCGIAYAATASGLLP